MSLFDRYDLDAELWFYYQIGLAIGVMLLTTLILFPGTPADQDSDDGNAGSKVSQKVTNPPLTEPARNETQAKQVKIDSQTIQTPTQQQESEVWTPYKKLNTMVWIALVCGAIVVLHFSYDLNWLTTNVIKKSREYKTLQGKV